ncbi:MAG: flagellar hook-length control protein FliK [Eubacterium sp.]|nr:flagellar hook-length control protein FliK [Eubacterium sp.]
MMINMDPQNLSAKGVQQSAPVSVATDGNGTMNVDRTKESFVQAEIGNRKEKMTTGSYSEEMVRQMQIDEIRSDLDVMDPVNFISRSTTGEDARDLSEDKTPLEEYTDSSLERALIRVKRQRADELKMLDSETEKLKETEERYNDRQAEIALAAQLSAEMSRMVSGSDPAIGQEMSDVISRQIARSELAVTQANIDDLKKAAESVQSITDFTESALRFMVTNENKVTPRSIQDSMYGSGEVMIGGKHQGASAGKLGVPDDKTEDGFSEVSSQIEKMLLSEDKASDRGTEVIKEKMDIARWLYQNDLPVTKTSIEQTSVINELKNMDTETLLGRIVSEMEDGILADNADLSNISRDEAAELVKRLVNSDDTAIKNAYPMPESEATARRRLEEIRLTMTVSAAREMTKLGITIDIGNLEEIVEGLRETERQNDLALFEETGLAPTESNMTAFKNTLDAASSVLASPVELLSYTFESRKTITLTEISATGRTLAAGYGMQTASGIPAQSDIFKRLNNTYEAVGTQVRSDLGDSIRKAFSNVDSMLDEIGVEKTPENERAVRILGYNRMEITADSIMEMKTYDNRVNAVMSAMKPQVVKNMIEEGIDPLELSLDELEASINRIYSETGAEDVSFSRFLWKLDKQREITPEERESMIGIYRLLDKIEKSDGAVVGQLVNEGRELSLKNMLEATRTRRKGGIDARIDDETGVAQAAVSGVKKIDAQIMTAFISSEIPAVRDVISPEVIKNTVSEDMTAWEFFDAMAEISSDAAGSGASAEAAVNREYYEMLAGELRENLDSKDQQLDDFLNGAGIPRTVRNIISAGDFYRSRMSGVRELWDEDESEDVIESFDDSDELEGIYENIEKNHLGALEKIKESDDITFDRMRDIQRMAGHISFYRQLRRHQMFEVPVVTERGVVDVNITLMEGEKDNKGRVEITMNSDELGKLVASLKLSGTRISGFITAEKTESTDVYAKMLDGFEKDLEEIGFTMDGNSLITGSRNSLRVGDEAAEAKNQDLYRIAKCFLRSVTK